MRIDYFTRFAAQLCALHELDPGQVSWEEVRQWLLDAPSSAPDAAMPVWTHMMKLAIAHGTNTSQVDPGIVHALGKYLDRLAVLPPLDLAKTVQLRMFHSLVDWLKPSPEKDHPSVEMLVHSGWEPTDLLHSLDDNRDTIVAFNNAQLGYSRPFDETGAGAVYRRIAGLLGMGTWVPKPDPIYEILFETDIVFGKEFQEHDCRFIRSVLEAAPTSLYKALWFVHRQEFLQESHLQALFPFSLDHGNDEYMLDALIALVVDEPSGVKGMAMPLLCQHHPDLAALVTMHLSLFPDAAPGKTYAKALVESYQRMLGQPQATAFGPVDMAVFETP